MPFPNNPYSSMPNPFAQQPYGQVQPPQMPHLNSLQQTRQQAVPTIQNGSLYGRVVGDLNDIVPDDVPRDGSIGLYPIQDYSCIFAKQWNNDGSISTLKFVPEVEPQQEQTKQVDISAILNRLDDIETLVKNLNYRKPYQKHNNRPNDQASKDEVSE